MKLVFDLRFLCLLFLTSNAVITNTGASVLEANLDGCATEDQAASVTDFFPYKVHPQYSETWDVSYHGTYKLLVNKVVNETYVLYQCGTTPPQNLTINYRVMTPIPLPDGVALTSTVQIPMFELLGLRPEIKTYLGDSQYISSPCMLEALDSGTLEVYDPTVAMSETAGAVLWSSSHTERIVIDNQFMTSAGQGTDKTIIENGYLEAGAMAIFEWIHFYSTLYNKEQSSQEIFDETKTRYDCTSSNAQLTAETGAPDPVAIWAYFSDYPGYEGWLTAKCTTKFNYYCEFAKRCQIDLLSQETGALDDAQFEEFAKDADIFFYDYTNWDEVYANKTEMLDRFKSVQNKQVYDHEASGESTWWEQRMAEFDVALEDVCTIANMTTDLSPHKLHWFRNIFTDPIAPMDLNTQICKDPTAPLVSRATECTPLQATVISDNTSTGTGSPASTIHSFISATLTVGAALAALYVL